MLQPLNNKKLISKKDGLKSSTLVRLPKPSDQNDDVASDSEPI